MCVCKGAGVDEPGREGLESSLYCKPSREGWGALAAGANWF